MKHLHVTGCGRSGTTLLVEMFRASFKHHGNTEHEKSILEIPPATRSVYITKCPGEMDSLKSVLNADQNLYGINIVRDPRSVICSIHTKAADVYATNFPSWKKAQLLARELKSNPRFIEIRYEQLIEGADTVQEDVLKAWPFLEKTALFSSYHDRANPSKGAVEALNGLRKLDKSRIEPWKNHLPRVKEQLSRHPEMADMLIELGYERDKKWTECLKGVKAVHHRVWEEKSIHFMKRLDRWQRRKRKLRKRMSQLKQRRELVSVIALLPVF